MKNPGVSISLITLLSLNLMIPISTGAGWYDSNWEYRKEIVFNQSQIEGGNKDFRALIELTDTDLKKHAQDDGGDIVFTASNGTYKLPHETEKFDGSTGELLSHVKVPNMTNKTDTSIYMYYSNPSASSQEKPGELWGESHEAVYHLNESASGTGSLGIYEDSTSESNDGEDQISSTGKEGFLLEGQEFDGSDDYIYSGSANNSQDPIFSMSMWVKRTGNIANDGFWGIGQGSSGNNINNYIAADNSDCPQNTVGWDLWASQRFYTDTQYPLNEWIHVTWVKDDTGMETASLNTYVNGSKKSLEKACSSGQTSPNVQDGLTLGTIGESYGGSPVKLDEVRYYKGAYSEERVKTQYNNQGSPSSFYSIKGQESRQRSEYVNSFLDEKPRTFLPNNTEVTIETAGDFGSNPEFTIIDSSGQTQASEVQTTNVSGLYRYNYTLNGTSGWYDVKFDNKRWENVFYQSPVWKGNFTDADGNKYTFRRELNVTEPGISDRFNTPVELNVDFDLKPDNQSIRVVSWNGSRMLEIPSQLYNISGSEGEVSNANIVFLSSLNKSEKRTYYLTSSKSEYPSQYEGLNNTDETSETKTENKYFKSYFNQSQGGLLRSLRNKIGTGESLSGIEPMDYYLQTTIIDGVTPDTITARSDFTAEVNVSEGPIKTSVSVEGGLDGLSSYPYSVECDIYAANPYMICEKNLTTKSDEDWKSLYLNGLIFGDGNFGWTAFRNSSGIIETSQISSGDNADTNGVDSQADWVTFFDNTTGDAVAEIYLERNYSVNESPKIDIRDNTDNDFYQSLIIDSSTPVSAGDSWSTKTARMIYSGLRGWGVVNETYEELKNPVSTKLGSERTNDDSSPKYSDIGNVSSNDTSEVVVESFWEDDTFLDYAEINITGNGVNGSKTQLYYNNSYEIRDSGSLKNTSWVNITLDNSTVNAGNLTANITVYDVSGKSNYSTQEINVSDATPPEPENIINSPDKPAGLDPESRINITANLTEYSNITKATLYYSNSSSAGYSSKEMKKVGEEDFVHTFESNFTAESEDNYSYIISAEDTLGRSKNSSEEELEVEWDYTWELNTSLKGDSATYNENISAGNLSIKNTGDFAQKFDLTNGIYNTRTWLNSTQLPESIELGEGESRFYKVNATTRDSTNLEDVDTFNLTVESNESSKEEFAEFDITTSTGGPFLFTEITQYNSTVTQGDQNITIEAETTNKGNETANDVNITFELPSDWTASEGSGLVSSDSLILDVGTTKKFTTKVDVGDEASTGTKKLVAVSKSREDIREAEEDIEVNNKSSESSEDQQEDTDDGGGGGGTSNQDDTELSQQEKEKLFQTEESFEIIRGEDQEFPLKIQNPFSKGELEDIEVEVSGFLSQYLSVEPEEIDSVAVNSSKNFTIKIEAPRYFTRGEYTLNFNITGINNRTQLKPAGEENILVGETQEFREKREIKLIVHEIPEEEAEESLNESLDALKELNQSGYLSTETLEKIEEANNSLEQGNYKEAKEISEDILSSKQTAEETEQELAQVKELVGEAENRGLDSPRTERMVTMAEAALERGDYSMAAQRAQEAKNIYALETQGKTNYINYTKNNWKKISLAGLLIITIFTVSYLRYRLFKVKRKLSKLDEEEETIKGLMRQVQRESFEEGKMSMEEYEEAMMQYEQQFSENVKQTVKMETMMEAWPMIWQKTKKLEQERDRVQRLMEQTQQKYLEEGELDTRVYKQKMQTFRERLSEIEGKLAEKEAKKKIKGQKSLIPHPF